MSTPNNETHIIQQLLTRKACGEILSASDEESLGAWAAKSDHHRLVVEQAGNNTVLAEDMAIISRIDTDSVWQKTKQLITPEQPAKVVPMKRWWWVAAVILIVTAATYFYLAMPGGNSPQPVAVIDVAPGKEGAILTLADGSQMVLDSLGNGVIAEQNGTQVTLNGHQLHYDASAAAAVSYNTISTPRGRQYKLVLPDGSKVWLNAASSIQFPTAFKNKERLVKITGEAYFEVTKNEQQPFVVATAASQVQVLGTSFNINAYEDEDSQRTTLLTGSVRVAAKDQSTLLKPGQQARLPKLLSGSPKITVSNDVNLNKVMAWKNGFFNFEGVSFKHIMNQLVRWYNIEVIYEGDVPNIEFFGEMSRDVNLSDVLKTLQDAGVKFRMENDKRLIVSQ